MKLKRIISKVILLNLLIVILLSPIVNIVNAESSSNNSDSIHLAISEFRGKDSDNTYPAYGLPNQHIYKIYQTDEGKTDYNKAIMCLDVSRGFTTINSDGTSSLDLHNPREYNISKNMLKEEDKNQIIEWEKQYNRVDEGKVDTSSFDEEDYDKIVSILKNSYIPEIMSKDDYLSEMISGYDASKYYITQKDIEVAEQLAIWHYTNELTKTGSTTFGNLLGNSEKGIANLYTAIYSDEACTNLDEIITFITELSGLETAYDSELYKLGSHKYYEIASQICSGYNELEIDELIPTEYSGMQNRWIGINQIYKSLIQIAEGIKETTSIDKNYDTKLTYWTNISHSTTQPVAIIEKSIIEKTEIEVEKVWVDNNNKDGIRPTNIQVQLKKNGENYGDPIVLNEENAWKYKWENLDKKEDGKEIKYTVEEISNIEGYETTYETIGNKITIINEHETEKTSYEVEKIWVDEENRDKIRPEYIYVQLKKNGENYGDPIILNAGNEWKHTWEDLDKNEDGSKIEYTVEEISSIEGYETKYEKSENKTTITNTHIVKQEVDLALRKFITAVGDNEYDRVPIVDFTRLIPNGEEKTAKYEHSKTPVGVKVGDIVTYTIRIYNEGQTDAYVGKVTDYLPEELTFISQLDATDEEIKKATEFNAGYGWIVDPTTGEISTEVLSANTDLDSMQKIICNEQKRESALLKAFDGKTLDYIDLKVKCKVNNKATSGQKITNIAEITKYEDEGGNSIDKDRDSEPGNFPDDKKNNDYEGNGNINEYWPGQEDDDDFERLILQQFDLALRKFISDVDGKETTLREPVVDTTKLKDETSTTAEYNHIKQPITVVKGSIITYTIRVYNEGNIDGYVNEITDYLPPELEYIENSEINEKYKWKISKNGRTVTTTYLEYEYGKTDNLIKAYDAKKDVLDYKEVKIQCKVKDTAPYQTNITNLAQITEDCDSKGDEVEDRDSVPNDNFDLPEDKDLPKYKDDELSKSYIPGQEDDDDFEKINVVYFDLALRKIVSKAIVIEEAGQTVTETNHKFEDDPEAIVKVDLGRKNLDKVTVKFEYQIRITNEGLIEGYAKEIKDYIPEGLEFKAEENPLWKEVSEGVITTDALKDTLLKPGESKVVTVLLTWKNSQDNLGLKTNTAEISKDYNEFNTPDIDSTPDNKKDGEDDIDIAEVMLSIALGNAKTYIGLTLIMLITTAGGIYLIRKFVL